MRDSCHETILTVLELLKSNQPNIRVFRELQNIDHCNNPKLHKVKDRYRNFISQTPDGNKTLENIQNYKPTNTDMEKLEQLSQYTEWTKQQLISSLSSLERINYLFNAKSIISIAGKVMMGVFIYKGTINLVRSIGLLKRWKLLVNAK